MTYKLAVGAVFRDERHEIVEWVEHYLFHGVEHFYLTDDRSMDDGPELLRPYIDRGIVDLYREQSPYNEGRMQRIYDRNVMPWLKDTEWLLICDLDEFIWSPRSIDLTEALNEFTNAPAVTINHTIFGSNGHDKFPDGVVASYTMRERVSPSEHVLHKYFVNARKADLQGLAIHWPILGSGQLSVSGQDAFVFNHYLCQCKEWWRTVKGPRGHADPLHTGGASFRDWSEFNLRDRNEVEDLRLRDQNMPLIEKLRG